MNAIDISGRPHVLHQEISARRGVEQGHQVRVGRQPGSELLFGFSTLGGDAQQIPPLPYPPQEIRV